MQRWKWLTITQATRGEFNTYMVFASYILIVLCDRWQFQELGEPVVHSCTSSVLCTIHDPTVQIAHNTHTVYSTVGFLALFYTPTWDPQASRLPLSQILPRHSLKRGTCVSALGQWRERERKGKRTITIHYLPKPSHSPSPSQSSLSLFLSPSTKKLLQIFL